MSIATGGSRIGTTRNHRSGQTGRASAGRKCRGRSSGQLSWIHRRVLCIAHTYTYYYGKVIHYGISYKCHYRAAGGAGASFNTSRIHIIRIRINMISGQLMSLPVDCPSRQPPRDVTSRESSLFFITQGGWNHRRSLIESTCGIVKIRSSANLSVTLIRSIANPIRQRYFHLRAFSIKLFTFRLSFSSDVRC